MIENKYNVRTKQPKGSGDLIEKSLTNNSEPQTTLNHFSRYTAGTLQISYRLRLQK
jgi:hypothetical protein